MERDKVAHLSRSLTVAAIAMVRFTPNPIRKHASSSHASHIKMESWVKKTLSMTRISPQCVSLALYYLAKLLNHPIPHWDAYTQDYVAFPALTTFQVHEALFEFVPLEHALVTVSLMLADTFLNDATFTVTSWSTATDIPASVLILMHRETLYAFDHSLNVHETIFELWKRRHVPDWIRKGLEIVQQRPHSPVSLLSPRSSSPSLAGLAISSPTRHVVTPPASPMPLFAPRSSSLASPTSSFASSPLLTHSIEDPSVKRTRSTASFDPPQIPGRNDQEHVRRRSTVTALTEARLKTRMNPYAHKPLPHIDQEVFEDFAQPKAVRSRIASFMDT